MTNRWVARRDDALRARLVEVTPLPGVRAGSALVRLGDRLVVVQDDVASIAFVDLATRAVRPLPLRPGGERGDAKLAKADLEVAFVDARGALWLLGSGATDRRRSVVRIVDADGPAPRIDWREAGALYDAVAERLCATPNVEGARLSGDRLQLFHRGAGSVPSALVDVAAAALDGGPADARPAVAIDFGRVEGVALAPTDVAELADGRFAWLGVAEDTPDAVADGPIVGSAFGVGTSGGSLAWTVLREADGAPSARKCEGLVLDGGAPRSGWVVTDPDDADRWAELARLELDGAW